MGPAESEPHLLPTLGERGVAEIAIHLQDAVEVAKVLLAPVGMAFDGCCFSLCQCGLDFLKAKFELVAIELLRSATKTMALQSINNGFQPLYFSLRGLERVDLARLIEDTCAERIYVIGKVRLGKHEPMNR